MTEMTEKQLLEQLLDQKREEPVRLSMDTVKGFEALQRAAKLLCSSSLVPERFQGEKGLPNAVIALELATRIGASPLMVMQHLYVVYGTPGWSAQFLIASVNSSGRFSTIRYEWKGEPGTDAYGCRAWVLEKSTGERLNGSWITMKMVKDQGWWSKPTRGDSSKNSSKWPVMTEQMFMYRAGAYWQRAYAPEIGMGLRTVEELQDESQNEGMQALSVDDILSHAEENAPSKKAESESSNDEQLASAQEQLAMIVGDGETDRVVVQREREPGEEG